MIGRITWDLVIVTRNIGKVIRRRRRRYWERRDGERADVVIVEGSISHSDAGVLVVDGFHRVVMKVERDIGEVVLAC